MVHEVLSKGKDSYGLITNLSREDIETVFYKDGNGEDKQLLIIHIKSPKERRICI